MLRRTWTILQGSLSLLDCIESKTPKQSSR